MDERWPHPACDAIDKLLASCDIVRTRGGGPGGQHRNRVDTRVVITHRPTGVTAEAGERRSQMANRKTAIFRLRLRIALSHREPVPIEREPSPLWRSRCRKGRVVLSPKHDDFPAVLAEVLDVLETHSYDVKVTASHFDCSATQLVRLLRDSPVAFARLNQQRGKAGKRPYR